MYKIVIYPNYIQYIKISSKIVFPYVAGIYNLHSSYYPAIECLNEDKGWYLNGKLVKEKHKSIEQINV